MPRRDDRDWAFLDDTVAQALDITDLVAEIKDLSDDPAVLLRVLKIEATALIIQKRTRDYRPRLSELKDRERLCGGENRRASGE